MLVGGVGLICEFNVLISVCWVCFWLVSWCEEVVVVKCCVFVD